MAQEIIFKGSLVGVSPARYWGPANSPLKVFTAILRRGGGELVLPLDLSAKECYYPSWQAPAPNTPGEN